LATRNLLAIVFSPFVLCSRLFFLRVSFHRFVFLVNELRQFFGLLCRDPWPRRPSVGVVLGSAGPVFSFAFSSLSFPFFCVPLAIFLPTVWRETRTLPWRCCGPSFSFVGFPFLTLCVALPSAHFCSALLPN